MRYRFSPEDLHETRVLVVEDDPLIAADLTEALTERGAEVVGPAGTLDEARAALEGSFIHAAVLDINLGGETSYLIAERLEAAMVPYVLITGHGLDRVPLRFRNRPILEKPFRVERIARIIARA